jgi:hypothetical protein
MSTQTQTGLKTKWNLIKKKKKKKKTLMFDIKVGHPLTWQNRGRYRTNRIDPYSREEPKPQPNLSPPKLNPEQCNSTDRQKIELRFHTNPVGFT